MTGVNRNVSRRQALTSTVTAGLVTAVAGCFESTEDRATELLGVHPDELTDIRFTQWPGALREAAAVAYVEPVEALAGITVNLFDHPVEVDSLSDLIHADEHTFDFLSHWNYTVPRGVDMGVYQPIRTENVPNLDRVIEQFDPSSVGYDPGDDVHHVPYSIGGNVIVYNTEQIEEPTSWNRLLEEDLAGELWMPRTTSMIMGMLSRQAGLELATVEGNEAAIWDLIDQYNEIVDHWWTDPSALDTALADGRVTAAGYWSGRAYALQQAGHPIDFTVPEEGTNAWVDVLSIPTGVTDPARRTAEAIMNFAMREDAIIDFASEIGYAVAYDVDDETIPEGHIYNDHPTWEFIETGQLEVWDAASLRRHESQWNLELSDRID